MSLISNQTIKSSITHLYFDIVDIFGMAQRDLGVVSIISAILDLDADVELFLVALYEKTTETQQ